MPSRLARRPERFREIGNAMQGWKSVTGARLKDKRARKREGTIWIGR